MNDINEIVKLINTREVVISAGALTVQLSELGKIGNEMCLLWLEDKTPTKEQVKEWVETIATVVDWGIESLPSEAKEFITKTVQDKTN